MFFVKWWNEEYIKLTWDKYSFYYEILEINYYKQNSCLHMYYIIVHVQKRIVISEVL